MKDLYYLGIAKTNLETHNYLCLKNDNTDEILYPFEEAMKYRDMYVERYGYHVTIEQYNNIKNQMLRKEKIRKLWEN